MVPGPAAGGRGRNRQRGDADRRPVYGCRCGGRLCAAARREYRPCEGFRAQRCRLLAAPASARRLQTGGRCGRTRTAEGGLYSNNQGCSMSDKAVITCALNGVLTDPKHHHVPVTPEEMAREAKSAFEAGASVMHIHLRQQGPGKGHLPSWEVAVSREIQQAIREACPGVIINHTTGTSGPNYQGALDCVRETRPEMAACNAGSLNYLKVKADNTWAWPPMMFDNAVEKVQDYLDVMKAVDTIPEFECF